jgi:hypothetical protein
LWLTLLLQRLPQKLELAEEHMRTKLGRGPATQNTATALALMETISLAECPDSTESLSWGLLPWLYVKGDFQDRVMVPWLKSQSKVPSTLWLRPSEKMDKKTPSGRRAPHWATFTAATEIVHKGQPKRNTTKGLTGLRLSSHPLFPSHRITPRNRRTRGSSAFLGNAVMQILQSFESREATNKAALPLKHCFY